MVSICCYQPVLSPRSLVVPRTQSNSAAAPATRGGGRLNNAAEFAVTKLDDLINWARTVSWEYSQMDLVLSFQN